MVLENSIWQCRKNYGVTDPGCLLDLRKDVASASGDKQEVGMNIFNTGSYSGTYLKIGRESHLLKYI